MSTRSRKHAARRTPAGGRPRREAAPAPVTIVSRSPAETERAGARLGALLQPGDLVLLTGPYGAGKTCFTRGLALGAEVPDLRVVTSPTFVLMNVYNGRVRVHHLDCHRLSPAEVVDLGLGDDLQDGAVVVEWGERVPPDLAESVLVGAFALTGRTSRRLVFSASGERAGELLEGMRAAPRGTPRRPKAAPRRSRRPRR
jgi:tRNA threonylcarbamoyladenosine biosynthesis protein TsaE